MVSEQVGGKWDPVVHNTACALLLACLLHNLITLPKWTLRTMLLCSYTCIMLTTGYIQAADSATGHQLLLTTVDRPL